jgi:flagellar hook-associated protein 1 FlgK
VTVAGTFSSFGAALSALRYNRTAMDIASGNIANASTPGYARRSVIGQTVGVPSTPALWSRNDGDPLGVTASRIDRMTNPLVDARSRAEHGILAYADSRAAALQRFENTLGEPGEHGVAAALADFKAGWADLANAPDDGAARSQLIARANTLVTAIGKQAGNVATEWTSQRERLVALAEEANTVSAQLVDVNENLRLSHLSGEDPGPLLDQRDQLAMHLAELTGGTVDILEDTTVDIRVGGQLLVQGYGDNRPLAPGAQALTVGGPATFDGADTADLTVQVGGSDVTLGGGDLRASQQVANDDLPGYLGELDAFVTTLADGVNALHGTARTPGGAIGGDFFSFDVDHAAASLSVAVDADGVAAAAAGAGEFDGSIADQISAAALGAPAYRDLVSGLGATVAAATGTAESQALFTAQVDASRESISGVYLDEEMINLLTAQRAYEGASRVLTTLDSMLDTLINRTGIGR